MENRVIYLIVKGVSTEILNVNKYQLFNWYNFNKGDIVYLSDLCECSFVSYEKSNIDGFEKIVLEIK